MTFQIDYEATRKAGLLLVADAADVAVEGVRVLAPDTGYRADAAGAAVTAITECADGLATAVTEDGETLGNLTSAALMIDLVTAGEFLWG